MFKPIFTNSILSKIKHCACILHSTYQNHKGSEPTNDAMLASMDYNVSRP